MQRQKMVMRPTRKKRAKQSRQRHGLVPVMNQQPKTVLSFLELAHCQGNHFATYPIGWMIFTDGDLMHMGLWTIHLPIAAPKSPNGSILARIKTHLRMLRTTPLPRQRRGSCL